MSLKLVTAPICEPLAIADIEGQLQTTLPTDQTVVVQGYIGAVRQKAETALSRAIITQTWELVLDAFPASGVIDLPLPPLQSVVSITYTDVDGNTTTLAVAEYVVDAESTPGRVMLGYEKTWPDTRDYPGAVRVRFVAGYGGPVAWDALTVYAVGALVYYTNGITYLKTTASAAGVLPTDATKWAVDHPWASVPACIRSWMLLNVTNLYENRESNGAVEGNVSIIDLTSMADSLLDPERWRVQV